MPKFATKNALFGFLWPRILKNYFHIRNQHPRICQTAKFRGKMKIPKFSEGPGAGPSPLYKVCHGGV